MHQQQARHRIAADELCADLAGHYLLSYMMMVMILF